MARPEGWESIGSDAKALNTCKTGTLGRLAQLGEHQLDKLGVTGSSPVPPIARKPCKCRAFVVSGENTRRARVHEMCTPVSKCRHR